MINKRVLIFLFLFLFLFPLIFASSYGDEVKREGYTLSRSNVDRIISKGNLFEDIIGITNLQNRKLSVTFTTSGDIGDLIEFTSSGIEVFPENTSYMSFYIKGTEPGNYSGEIYLSGDIIESLPVNIIVVDSSLDSTFFVEIEPTKKSFKLNKEIEFKINLNKLKLGETEEINLTYAINNSQGDYFPLGKESLNFTSSYYIIKKFNIPEKATKGSYVINVLAETDKESMDAKAAFILKKPFFTIILFGFLPMWVLILFLSLILITVLVFIFIKKHIKNAKKYKMELDVKKLPKFSKSSLKLGKIAETKIGAYLEPDKMKTHTIIAGATGGGKSISAQSIVEEVLLQNIAVIVFDPTAQWSGMLRKCEDKKMISLYPKFGLKPSDARAFPGNIHSITDAREIIEVDKYMNPGQIQIFTLNKLDPKDMDIFVANVIRQIFKSDPKETPDLKLLLVFDEVHRLLSKFGGSGEGFLQIERACREFRKWGMGVMLVSQVLSDFVGEIKANISTEIQMRTRDEGDLGRIKTKYGETFLQSLVKASVGVGMFVNPAYNKAKPYFINFRPILHNTRRLSDEELEKYNKYNELVDDMDYQIEQLEKLKIDVFDFKMELKLVKDKVMTGNFSVVDIYIEGLKPRLDKQWEKLGKKPQKKQKLLADLSEIKKSVEEARKARDKFEKEEAIKTKAQEVLEPKKEDNLDEKIVNALTFDNGIMVSSLKELKEVLPNLDEDIFRLKITNNKNEISIWLEQISKELADKVKPEKTKQKIIEILATTNKKPEPKEKKE
jgi:hypothetical protein